MPKPFQEELPTGTITFLLTDIESSTELWEQNPEPMRGALIRHDAIFDAAVDLHSGVHVRPNAHHFSGSPLPRLCIYNNLSKAFSSRVSHESDP